MTAAVDKLDACDFSASLIQVRDILETATTQVTLWGNRVINLQGSSRSFYVNDLAEKVLTTCYKCINQSHTAEENAAGRKIYEITQQMLDSTDRQCSNRNYLTQLLCWFWDSVHRIRHQGFFTINFFMYDTRFRIRTSNMSSFFPEEGKKEEPLRTCSKSL